MAPAWFFLAAIAAVIASMVAVYWRGRAGSAERKTKELEKWLDYWQDNSVELTRRLMAMEAELQEADTDEEAVIEEYVGVVPEPQSEAQMFNFASEVWLYRWLGWNPRHD